MLTPEKHILPRPRVADALAASVRAYPLTVLSAPLGYGKSTAARALLRRMGHPALHALLNPAEASAEAIWASVGAQVEAVFPDTSEAFLQNGVPRGAAATRRFLEYFLRQMAGRHFLLILDDFHHARDPDYGTLLEQIVRARLSGFSLLLISRERPTRMLAFDDLILKGLAHEFGQELLAFSEEDAKRYFALHGVDDKEVVRAVWKNSEGWPAALWLGLESYKSHGVPTSIRNIENLIESVVFNASPEAEQRLLLELSPLDDFSPEQAAYVSYNPGAPQLLAALLDHNAMLSRDPATGRYRMHSMLRSFLARRLASNSRIDVAALHRRAARWFLRVNDPLRALRFFFQAGEERDQMAMLDIFSLPNRASLFRTDPEGVCAMVATIPWSIRLKNPMAYLSFIFSCLYTHSIAKAVPLAFEAERMFMADQGLAPELRKRIMGELLLIRSLAAFNDVKAMSELYKRAHTELGGRSYISQRPQAWTFGCPIASFLYVREPGSYKEIVELAKASLPYFQELSDGCTAGGAELMRAEFLLETGVETEVEHHLMKAEYLASAKDQHATLICARFTRARLRALRGESGQAAACLHELEPLIYPLGQEFLDRTLEVALGYLYVCLGRHERIPEWLRLGDIDVSRGFGQGLGVPHLAHARALLLAREYPRALALAQSLPGVFAAYKPLFGSIHAHTIEAIALNHLEGTAAALAPLQTAVKLAQPDKILLSLAEYGAPLLPLLGALRKKQSEDPYLIRLEKMTASYAALNAPPAEDAMPETQDLSARETEVMQLLSQAHRNADIAQLLGISPNTAAKITSNAYKKLGAKNRVDALRRFAARKAY